MRSARHAQRHIPQARFALRSQLETAFAQLPQAARYVVTCGSGALACHVVNELAALTDRDVYLLAGGTNAWAEAGLPVESGIDDAISPAIDHYRRPYEGTNNSAQAMQDYLDWEYGLVEQLQRDGTHGFFVID